MTGTAASAELVLREFDPLPLPRSSLPGDLGEHLWRSFGKQVSVDFPSPATDGQWILKNEGWAGLVPLGVHGVLSLQPKVSIANVFRMLEYAYRVKAFEHAPETAGVESMQEIYESLARVLSRRIRDRARKGLHRRYQDRDERLTVVRGRLRMAKMMERPGSVALHCEFDEHTSDHVDNQLLFAGVDRILRSRICRPSAQREVREVHRLLRGAVSPQELTAVDARRRAYDRLNHDYRAMHALVAFFLSHTGPTHRRGEASMVPFLLDMAVLFETFVGEWLRENLPEECRLATQETGYYDVERAIGMRIDMVLYDRFGRPSAVLDTKYKQDQTPQQADINQVVTYALKKGCRQAVLIYPEEITAGHTIEVGGVRVRAIGFPLHASLQQGGAQIVDLLHQVTAQAQSS